MTTDIRDYVASGYFLSRRVDIPRDCTGIALRRVTLASDHSQRRSFPDSWTLSWCSESREKRLAKAAVFGISERQLDDVIAWADETFDSEFGAWSVFFTLEAAQAAARLMLQNAPGLELWGVGLHCTLLNSYCEESRPPPPRPGYAPTGASGTHIAACVRTAPLSEGGEVLGHELLIDDYCCFNSPESWHLDEKGLFRSAGLVPNDNGLIDSFDEALACCQRLDAADSWRPWLIVRYPLG